MPRDPKVTGGTAHVLETRRVELGGLNLESEVGHGWS